jgi:hypothetical protein
MADPDRLWHSTRHHAFCFQTGHVCRMLQYRLTRQLSNSRRRSTGGEAIHDHQDRPATIGMRRSSCYGDGESHVNSPQIFANPLIVSVPLSAANSTSSTAYPLRPTPTPRFPVQTRQIPLLRTPPVPEQPPMASTLSLPTLLH